MRKKHHKTKRRQPSPKKKKGKRSASCSKGNAFERQFKSIGEDLVSALSDKEAIKTRMSEDIERIESYYRRYDSVQLMGSIGLYLIDNLPTFEKSFIAQMSGSPMTLDEDAEILAEYALNFGLSMPNDGTESPPSSIVNDLRESLRSLYKSYCLIDMPLQKDASQFIDWVILSDTISVRGDGYSEHIEEVFKELFGPHSSFFVSKYGFSSNDLLCFFVELENRIICKLGDQNMVYGPMKMYDRWRAWRKTTYGLEDDSEDAENISFTNGLFGDFFEANPDVRGSEDGMSFLLFPPDDYANSDRIFWVYPQNDTESSILASLSVEFGDNASFIAEGEFKGNILNGHSIYEKPFLKVGDRYYCFTPMIPYRNLFLIAEKLIMRDNAYYDSHFRNNTSPIARDNYIEGKVKSVMQSFLPEVDFYPSVTYHIVEDGVEKKTELDLLGVSEKATYIIEIKAHELSHKDRVGLVGAKYKFNSSVVEACSQSNRARIFILNSSSPVFNCAGTPVLIDITKPIYKIAVTFQHYSALLGYMDQLIEAGLMKDEYRDTWIVSLFDLMVCSDFIESEDEFLSYLEMHKTIYQNHSTFNDELDLLGQFLNNDLASKVRINMPMMIVDGHQDIDEEYSKDHKIPFAPVLPE